MATISQTLLSTVSITHNWGNSVGCFRLQIGWVMHLSRCGPVSNYAAVPEVINPNKEAANVRQRRHYFLSLSITLSFSFSSIEHPEMGCGNSKPQIFCALQFSSRNSRSKEDYYTDQWTSQKITLSASDLSAFRQLSSSIFLPSFLTSGRKNQLQCFSRISCLGQEARATDGSG